MSSQSHDQKAQKRGKHPLEVTVMSFGYKEGAPPLANLVFDVRFLKNPFWVEELRPLTGRDEPVQRYVLDQPLAAEFIRSVLGMLDTLLPRLEEQEVSEFSIAFGCTGGQHRSATMVEALASAIAERYPHYQVRKQHRELDGNGHCEDESAATPAQCREVKELG